MKPMLAVDHDPMKLKYPCYASPKLDGLRGLVHEGKLLSRSLKLIPNKHVQAILSQPMFEGMDGGLIAGSPTSPNAMQEATSFFMARDKVSDDFTFFVFDLHNDPDEPYIARHDALIKRFNGAATIGMNLRLHERRLINDEAELLEYEAECLTKGYEGLILRSLHGRYKFGRSTCNEGLLMKVKRFTDSEAKVIGFEEQLENTNEKQVNELGRSKRSSHKAGKVGKGTLGALVVQDIVSGVQFNVGTGLNDCMRDHIWANRPEHEGKTIKYKSFLVGVKDAPRHPVFISFRSPLDMS